MFRDHLSHSNLYSMTMLVISVPPYCLSLSTLYSLLFFISFYPLYSLLFISLYTLNSLLFISFYPLLPVVYLFLSSTPCCLSTPWFRHIPGPGGLAYTNTGNGGMRTHQPEKLGTTGLQMPLGLTRPYPHRTKCDLKCLHNSHQKCETASMF